MCELTEGLPQGAPFCLPLSLWLYYSFVDRLCGWSELSSTVDCGLGCGGVVPCFSGASRPRRWGLSSATLSRRASTTVATVFANIWPSLPNRMWRAGSWSRCEGTTTNKRRPTKFMANSDFFVPKVWRFKNYVYFCGLFRKRDRFFSIRDVN